MVPEAKRQETSSGSHGQELTTMGLLKNIRKRKSLLWYCYYKLFRTHGKFRFQGEEYPYFLHWYNRTWCNERIVEVPIVRKVLSRFDRPRVLEIGNVLSHYFGKEHRVVDKYEKSMGVENIDVVDLVSDEQFDVIVCISTLEHVGWDDPPRDSGKPIRALEHLKSFLAPGGCLIATIPLGYNPDIDRLLEEGTLKFDRIGYLKRVSIDNHWEEMTREQVKGAAYNTPFPAANALAIGIVKRQK